MSINYNNNKDNDYISANPELKRAFLTKYPCPRCRKTNCWHEIVWPDEEDDFINADCKFCRFNLFKEFNQLGLGYSSETMGRNAHQHYVEYKQKVGHVDAPWEESYLGHTCPYCGGHRVRYAKWKDKRMSVAFWGVWSQKLHSNYKCDDCGTMWE